MKIIRFKVDDILELKKPHPCGSTLFSVIRIGSDVRIRCTKCLHNLEIERIKLEKSIKKVLPSNPDTSQESTSSETNVTP